MIPNWYQEYKNFIDISIENFLKDYFKNEKNNGLEKIKEAVFYATKGGKRLRAILALEFFLLFSGKKFEEIKKNDKIILFCIAIELLHAYSLVHDDLPAMDNDEYRRGELTCWKKFGETDAILVGDLLNSLSFGVLAKIKNFEILKKFSKAVGINGMLGGQVLDLFYEKNNKLLDLENLIETHNKKTGELIKVSIIGGILLSKNKKQIKNLKKYENFGKNLGLAFQIKDDLLDVEGSFEETGKSVGSNEKKGFVYFLGTEKTKDFLDQKIKECKKDLKDFSSEKIDFLVDYIAKRTK